MQNPAEHLIQTSRLWYSVAGCDGKLHRDEKTELKNAITDYRLLLFSTGFWPSGTKVIAPGEVLSRILSEHGESSRLLEDFKNYFTSHQEEFTPELRTVIIDRANKIAAAFARKNKSEIIRIAKIRLLLQQT